MTDLMIEARNALDVLAMLTETRPGNVRLNALDTLTRALKVVQADAQALADVRTLDEWAGDWGWLTPHMTDFSTGKRVGYIVQHGNPSERNLPPRETIGQTPEAARALAAAWVREQAKGAK